MRIESIQTNPTIGRIVRVMLLAGIVYFGFIFPDSLSTHEKILHFSAHMGMSFFIATCVYVICNMVLHLSRTRSLIILSFITLVVGAIYKYLEISSQGMIGMFSFGDLMRESGCYTSMSQNTAGLLAAILLIEYAVQYVRMIGIRIRQSVKAGVDGIKNQQSSDSIRSSRPPSQAHS